MEDSEGQGHVHDYTDETGSNSHVEATDTLLLINLLEAVSEAAVFVGFETLHLGLDDVDRVVCHGGAEAGKRARKEIDQNLDWDVVTKNFLGVRKHDESYTLVRRLLHEGGHDSLVASHEASLLENGVDSVEEVSVLRLRRKFVVNKLGFEGLLGRHN